MKILKITFSVVAICIAALLLFDFYLTKSYEKIQKELLEFEKELLAFEESIKIVEETPLQQIIPKSCKASSQASDQFSCERLYDLSEIGWEDDEKNCRGQWIEFEFPERIYIEYMIVKNYQEDTLFYRRDKIRDIELVFSDNHNKFYLIDEIQDQQWFDINYITNTVRINIITNYNVDNSKICHLEEVSFFGREMKN